MLIILWGAKLIHATGVEIDMIVMITDTLCDFREMCLKVSMHFAFEWTFLRSCPDMTFAWFLDRTC